jgi:hypothetical protein
MATRHPKISAALLPHVLQAPASKREPATMTTPGSGSQAQDRKSKIMQTVLLCQFQFAAKVSGSVAKNREAKILKKPG